MKIAVVAEPFVSIPPKKYGGVERVIYYQIKGLMERGHEVTLLAPGDSKVDCNLIPICEKHFFFGKDDRSQNELIKINKKIRQKTFAILEKIKWDIDLIHSHGIDLTDFQNFPHVVSLHGMFTLSHIDYYQNRKRQNYISISNNQRESFPDLNYVGTVYNAEDPEEFPFISKPEDYLCFLGRLDREKNPLAAIQLAIALDMKIKVAGKVDFQGKDYFDKELKPYFDHPLVEYLGELDNENKIRLMGNAICNLHPITFREPFGLTVMEAAYLGTPTIANRLGAMSELIEDGRTGILVEDFTEGFHRIKQCFDMDRSYISKRSRMLFNYQTMASDLEKNYLKVIEKHKRKTKGNGHNKIFSRTNHLSDRYTSAIEVFWDNMGF